MLSEIVSEKNLKIVWFLQKMELQQPDFDKFLFWIWQF